MTYDPFQSNATPGAYAGAGNPFYSPFAAMQTSAINPFMVNPSLVNPTLTNPYLTGQSNLGVAWNPLNGYQGIPQSILAGQVGYAQQTPWQNPLLQASLHQGGLHNGITHNPYAQQLAIQLAAQQLAQQIVAQQVVAQQAAQQAAAQQLAALGQGQQTGFYGQNGQNGITGQQGSPFGQTGLSQTGFGQMAPQSWVGQQTGQQGSPANAILLAQLTARALQAQGLNPGLTPGLNFPV